MTEFLHFLRVNWPELLTLTREHIFLVVISTGFAVLFGVPLGILLTRVKSLQTPILGFANIMQTVPSLALFGLLIPIPFIGGIGARTAIIALALYLNGSIDEFYIPDWVKVAAGLAIAAGTYVGGWRIIRTLGQRVFNIEPASGFAAQTAAGTVLYGASIAGFPVSTTQCISGAVMGAGATKRLSAVRWGVAGNIVVAWVLTIPAAAIVAALLFWPIEWIT